jgi:hypothetical protein
MKDRSKKKKKAHSNEFAEKRDAALKSCERQLKDIKEGVRSHEPRRLKVGDVFRFNGVKSVVTFVHESRARIAPLNAPIKWRQLEGQKIQFLARDQVTDDVSATSQVEIIKSYGREGLAKYLDERGDVISEQRRDNMAKNKKEKAEKGASTGKLGGYKGHSITSVIRAFGKAGWTLDEARAWFKQEKIEVADNTIKIQLRRGAKGEEEGAPLSKKELAEIKPVVKASKKDKDKSSKKDKKSDKKKSKSKEDDEDEDEEEEADEDEDEEEEKPSKKSKKDKKSDDEDEDEEEGEDAEEGEEEDEEEGD